MARRRSNKARNLEDARLLEVLERVLDKGIVCHAWASISIGGIELGSVEAHVEVTSIETYLKYAEPRRIGPQAARSDERVRRPEGTALSEPTREQTSQQLPGAARELPAPEAVVRAVEHYLRQLRQGGQPD